MSSDEELLKQLAHLQSRNAVLSNTLAQKDDQLKHLSQGMKETISATEVEEERMTNAVLRRVGSLQKDQGDLLAHLHAEEAEKTALENRLHVVENENQQLKEHLLLEEKEIQDRIQKQLAAISKAKQQLEGRLLCESAPSTPSASHLDLSIPEVGVPPMSSLPTATTASHSKSTNVPAQLAELQKAMRVLKEPSPTSTAVCTPVVTVQSSSNNSKSSLLGLAPISAPPPLSPAGDASSVAGTVTPMSVIDYGPGANSFTRSEIGMATTSPVASSGGRATAGSQSPAPFLNIIPSPSTGSTTPNAELAADSSMLGILQKELVRLQQFKKEAQEQAALDAARHEQLMKRLEDARGERERYRGSSQVIQNELKRTRNLTKEIMAKHELLVEWNTDREINLLHHPSTQRSASACSATESVRAEMASLSASDAFRTETATPVSECRSGILPTSTTTIPSPSRGGGGPLSSTVSSQAGGGKQQ